MRPSLALLGVDPRVLEVGMRAVRQNIPIAGLWAPDHNQALVASLRLGCCAFPRAAEPLAAAHWVVYSELDGALPQGLQALNVAQCELDENVLRCPGLTPDWEKWLRGLGFQPVQVG